MRKAANGGGGLNLFDEHPHLVAYAGGAQMPDPQATVHLPRVRQWVKKPALRLHHQTDRRTIFDIQQTVFNQKLVHYTVYIVEIDRVIYVSINIIICPPGRDPLPIEVILARDLLWFLVLGYRQLLILTTVRPVTVLAM